MEEGRGMPAPGQGEATEAGVRTRILVVDDEEAVRCAVAELLTSLGYAVETAAGGLAALGKLQQPFDLVLLDVTMPDLDGFAVAERIRRRYAMDDLPIIIVTALNDRAARLRAVEVGVNDFVGKPVEPYELRLRMASLLKMKRARDALKQHQAELEETVQARTAALRQALAEVTEAEQKAYQAHVDTIHRLALASEFRDEDTGSHILRISGYCTVLARALGLSDEEVECVRLGSLMHDVGKIGVPNSILLCPHRLTSAQQMVMRQHTIIGARILDGSPSALLQAGAVIALSHHEKWDGSGYPHGLVGADIPLFGRICAVADVFDALTSQRPYKQAFSIEEAVAVLRGGRGQHFDPEVLDAFLAHLDQIVPVLTAHRDAPEPKPLEEVR